MRMAEAAAPIPLEHGGTGTATRARGRYATHVHREEAVMNDGMIGLAAGQVVGLAVALIWWASDERHEDEL